MIVTCRRVRTCACPRAKWAGETAIVLSMERSDRVKRKRPRDQLLHACAVCPGWPLVGGAAQLSEAMSPKAGTNLQVPPEKLMTDGAVELADADINNNLLYERNDG